MKMALLVFLGLSAFGGAASAQEIKFETVAIDYGTISQGSDGTRVFKFKNVGEQEGIVYEVRSNCSCLVPKWSRAIIPPGGTGEITVKYDTQRVGAFGKSVTVSSNSKSAPTITLKILGTVNPPDSVAAPVK